MSVLYLHIGTPKTATTSLQMFCKDNQKILNQKGYSYPILDFRYPHVAIRRNGHFLVGKLYDGVGDRDYAREEKVWNRGIQMIHEEFAKFPNVILSDENIWNASRGEKFAQWERLKKDAEEHGYEIRVIVYLRRQDQFINSWLAQQVKEGWNSNACIKWDSFVKKPRNQQLDYYSHLEKISSVIGRENIYVRIFEREQFKGKEHSIFSDFLDVLGLEFTDEYKIKEEKANKSLTANSQEIVRVINSVLPDTLPVEGMIRRAAAVCEETKDPDNSFVMLSEEETKEFLKKYENGNAAIAREYLGREDGVLFSDKVKDGPRWTKNNEYMDEDIIRFFGHLVVEQQKQILSLQKSLRQIQESQEESLKKYLGYDESGNVKDGKPEEKDLYAAIQRVLTLEKELKDVIDKMNKLSGLEEKQSRIVRQIQNVKNEIFDVNRKIAEQNNRWKAFQKKTREQIKDLQQTAILFRLRRKTLHVLGKDQIPGEK